MIHRTVALAGALALGLTACTEATATGPFARSTTVARASASAMFPDEIPVPVSPEGIAIGTGHTFYVGNLAAGTGGIWVGDLRSGKVDPLRANDGRPTAGLKFDDRSGYLFAARGTSGWATILDAATGDVIADLQLAVPSSAAPTFVNDVIITPSAAYFTDSRRPVMYRVPLSAEGGLVGGFAVVPLTGDFVQGPITCVLPIYGGVARPGPLFANGIEATPNGRWLLINSLANGRLYRVDPETGEAILVDLGGGNVCLADGNLLAGNTLYVMQNLAGRIAVLTMASDYLSATIDRHIVGAGATPTPMTTMARFGNSIYAVTAGFAFLPGPHRVIRFDQ